MVSASCRVDCRTAQTNDALTNKPQALIAGKQSQVSLAALLFHILFFTWTMASAIDFAALVLEERKRARDQRRRKHTVSSGSNTNKEESVAVATPPRPCDTSWHRHRTLQPPPFDPAGTRIDSPIEAVHYVPEWLPSEYAEELKAWLLSLPERNNDSDKDDEEAAPCWTRLRHARRRVALFDGRPRCTCTAETPLPTPLDNIAKALVDAGIFPPERPPNHVLVNDYGPTEGIMAHTDGPLYWDRTATISMGGDVVLKFRRRLVAEEIRGADDVERQDQYPKLDLLLSGKGSLVLFTGDAYTNHLHSIGEGTEMEMTTDCCANAAPGLVVQRSNRISLTFRHKYEEATSTS